MAILFFDGFDKYLAPMPAYSDLSSLDQTYVTNAVAGEWGYNGSGYIGFTSPLSASGAALGVYIGLSQLTKTFATPMSTAIGGCRVASTLGAALQFAQIMSAGTTMFTLSLDAAGTISLLDSTGTVIGTSTATLAANVAGYVEWDVTPGATSTSGTYAIYLNGTSVISGTGANFGGATSSTWDEIYVGGLNYSSSLAGSIDDLYIDDGTGAPLLTNPIVETHFPASDSVTGFSVGGGYVGRVELVSASAHSLIASNTLYLQPITSSVNCTLTSISTIPTSTASTQNTIPAVYADSSGVPGTLLADGTAVTGATANTVLNLPLSSGVALTAGTQYWIGFLSDTSNYYSQSDDLGAASDASVTFGTPPSTAPTMTTGIADVVLWGVVSGFTEHYFAESEFPSGACYGVDINYVQSSTVGAQDLYGFTSMTSNPSEIYAVSVKAQMRDSDTGSRTVALQQVSGATTQTATAFTPSTTYEWYDDTLLTDPNTSAAWTQAGINSATGGFKVVS